MKTKHKKDVTKKTKSTSGKKSAKKVRSSGSGKSEQRNRKGKEKFKSISKSEKSISKKQSRIKQTGTRKDDELELLNSLFLKELSRKPKKTKQKLSFERRPNKENKRKRGNVFVIVFPSRSTFQQKIQLINNWDGKELKYYVDRFGKLPQAIQVILTTKKGGETFERATKISPFDFVVNVPNTKNFILEMMVSFQDNYIEYVESEEPLDSDWVYNPSKISKVTVRFIY